MSTPKVPLISVVDDDQSVVEGIVNLLESVGCAAVGFVSAQDFLKSAELRRTACLILDVCMPGIDGRELQRRLAAENIRTPIIFITAHGDQDAAGELLSTGAEAVLHKPFSQESLLAALRSALRQMEEQLGNENPI